MMHFRVRGSNVQIVRSVADPASGKAKSQPIGSASLKTGEISPKALAALAPAEVTEAQAWIARHREVEARRRELAFEDLPATLTGLREWVREADPTKIDPVREEVVRGLGRLRAALSNRKRKGEDADAGAEETVAA